MPDAQIYIQRDEDKVLLREEAEWLQFEDDKLYGLALSGGGIRSASLALGVMQGLVAGGILRKVHYLSTVSGGGYIGSSLTWFLNQGLPKGAPAGTTSRDFPFGLGDRTGPATGIVDFLRNRSTYLAPGQGLNAASLFAVLIRSMLSSLVAYLSLLTVVMFVVIRARAFEPLRPRTEWIETNHVIWAALFIVSLLVILAVAFAVRTRLLRGRSSSRYRWLVRGEIFIGGLWLSAIGLVILGSLPYAYSGLDTAMSRLAIGGGSAFVGVLLGVYNFWRNQSAKESSPKFANLRIVVGAFALIYGLTLSAYAIASSIGPIGFVIVLMIALITGVFVNLNYTGFHRVYRNRLMEALMPNPENVVLNRWGPATNADRALLETMWSDKHRGPFHIINTNVVLVHSPTSKYSGRGGDNFVLSPLYCGSKATGWRRTDQYMKGRTNGMTLPTAMAISGAAVNPHSGVGGRGVTRNRLVSTLMSLLNLRLGYWVPHPRVDRPKFTPNFLFPGLRGVLGMGFSEERRSLELSDGGHFENLGIYELIRRKVDVIIVCDAGHDPEFAFADLANAIERVRTDFGVAIIFDDEETNLSGIQPSVGQDDALAKKYNLSQRGFAIGKIVYPQDPRVSLTSHGTGTLIYIKSTLIGDLTEDIYGYKMANPTFPHQTTGDQFFDEAQLEAYRELGLSLASQFVLANAEAERPWIR